MKRYLLLAVLMIPMTAIFQRTAAQERLPQAPDNEAILREIMDNESPYYYPVLFTRYTAGDTTLNLEDYRHLYYGFAFQPQYKPLETPTAANRLFSILENNLDSITVGQCEDIITYGLELMESEPFNPGTINLLVFAYGALGDTLNERINHHRLQQIVAAILSSGTGLKESSAWHVLYFSHVADIMGHMGLTYGRCTVVSRSAEYVPLLQRGPNDEKGYYFNFERIYWNRPDKLPERKDSGWMFNNIRLKKKREYQLTE